MSNIIAKLINTISQKRQEKQQKQIEYISGLAVEMRSVNRELEQYITKTAGYFTYATKEKWLKKYRHLETPVQRKKKYRKLKLKPEIIGSIQKFESNLQNLDNIRDNYNEFFIETEKQIFKDIFDNVEGRALDDQQRNCIIKDEINNLVIAGAGSGKTTTIVGKVKYLLTKYRYSPDELLVVSFTNASAAEMAERIQIETGKSMDVMTFHKLGKEIIAEVEGKQPRITRIKLNDFIKEKFRGLLKDPNYALRLNVFFLSYLKEYKSEFDFKTQGDYFQYLKDNQIRTLKGEMVKSYEEMEIANFLYLFNIDYEYEPYYKYDTATREYGQYQPDFYLPDYDIYIEHFGIDRNGNVPTFFKGDGVESAKEKYNRSIEWKREIHQKHRTVLVETYTYYKTEGILTEKLRQKLEEKGVKFNPKSHTEILAII